MLRIIRKPEAGCSACHEGIEQILVEELEARGRKNLYACHRLLPPRKKCGLFLKKDEAEKAPEL